MIPRDGSVMPAHDHTLHSKSQPFSFFRYSYFPLEISLLGQIGPLPLPWWLLGGLNKLSILYQALQNLDFNLYIGTMKVPQLLGFTALPRDDQILYGVPMWPFYSVGAHPILCLMFYILF